MIIACGPEPTVRLLFHSDCACANADDSEHEVVDQQERRRLLVPGLGQRVFDHPTVFEPIFGLMATLPPEVHVYLLLHPFENLSASAFEFVADELLNSFSLYTLVFFMLASLFSFSMPSFQYSWQVPKYQAASFDSFGGVVTQLSLVTEQGFASFCRLLGRDIAPSHSIITAPLRSRTAC